MNILIGILIPLIGTTLGAACVFIMKKEINQLLNKGLLGFASGVMIAASVWSLIIPAIDMSDGMGKLAFLPAAIGVLVGIAFMLILDKIIPHLHLDNDKPEGLKSEGIKKTTMLVLAVVLHNIPEGMAVGIVFAGAMNSENAITIAGAFALSIGIAIQNFPEGAIISMPLVGEGISKGKAFSYGFLFINLKKYTLIKREYAFTPYNILLIENTLILCILVFEKDFISLYKCQLFRSIFCNSFKNISFSLKARCT